MDFAQTVMARLEDLGHNINSFEASQDWPQGFLRAVVRTDAKRTVPNIERAKMICDALGLEFYVGPPRLEIYPQSAHNRADGQYVTIPFDRRVPSLTGRSPLAFSHLWLRDHDLDPRHLTIAIVPSDDMYPSLDPGDLVLIDNAFIPEREPMLCAFNVGSELRVGWLTAPQPSALVGFFQRPYTPAVARIGREGPLIECLGRVIVRLDENPGPWIDAPEKRRLLALADDMIGKRRST